MRVGHGYTYHSTDCSCIAFSAGVAGRCRAELPLLVDTLESECRQKQYLRRAGQKKWVSPPTINKMGSQSTICHYGRFGHSVIDSPQGWAILFGNVPVTADTHTRVCCLQIWRGRTHQSLRPTVEDSYGRRIPSRSRSHRAAAICITSAA